MKPEEFDDYHEELDSIKIGTYSIEPRTNIIGDFDGSIVICSRKKDLKAWRKAHELRQKVNYATYCYGDVIRAVSGDGAPFHMDAPAAQLFVNALKQDLRFRPEVLTCESDGWTLVTSCFIHYNDSPTVLRHEIESFVLGYEDPSGSVVGRPSALFPEVSFKEAELVRPKMDALATCRLASIIPWRRLLVQLEAAEQSDDHW